MHCLPIERGIKLCYTKKTKPGLHHHTQSHSYIIMVLKLN